MNEGVFDTARTSEYLGLSMSTLEKARVYGTGPKFLRLGRAIRYRRCDLDAWLAARVVTSTSEKVPA